MYKRLRSRPLWVNLIASKGLGEIRREIAYRQDSNDKDRQVIISLVEEISSLEIDKKKLEDQKVQLSKLQTELDKQNSFFLGEVKKAKAYQSDLSNKIAQLSAKQQQLLAEKLEL
jgi:chromosome segregation ATPase